MQNWALRIVYGNSLQGHGEHTAENLTLLSCWRIMHLLSLMYHRSKNATLLDKGDLQTRQFDKIKFKVINPVIKKAFKIPNYLGAQLWDKLPLETQLSGSFTEFKLRVN